MSKLYDANVNLYTAGQLILIILL